MKMISNSRARKLGVRKVWKKIDLGWKWGDELHLIGAWCILQDSPKRFLIREAEGILQFEDPLDAADYVLKFDLERFKEEFNCRKISTFPLLTTSSGSLISQAQYIASKMRETA